MKRFAMAFVFGMAALPMLWAQAGATGPGTNPNPTPSPNTPGAPQTTTPPANSNKGNSNSGKPQTYGKNPPSNPGVKTPIIDPAKGALGNHGNTPANPYEGTTR